MQGSGAKREGAVSLGTCYPQPAVWEEGLEGQQRYGEREQGTPWQPSQALAPNQTAQPAPASSCAVLPCFAVLRSVLCSAGRARMRERPGGRAVIHRERRAQGEGNTRSGRSGGMGWGIRA